MLRKFATIDGKGIISVEEGPIPEPNKGELLIEVYASAISPGTELGGVKSRRKKTGSSPGRPFGYQNAGRVIKKGNDCDEFEIGDRVAGMGGGYALHTDFACVPKNLCVPIPDELSYEDAAFNHLAATALHAIRRGSIQISENVVVVGLGVVGQFCCQFARIAGAHVMGVDRLPLRLEIASNAGAALVVNVDEDDAIAQSKEFTRGYGMDCGIIAFGGDATDALKLIRQMLKRSPDTHSMGRIVIVGGAHISHGFAAALGNVDVRSSARPGPGYHDEDYERGKDYPPVFVEWTTKRNLEESLRCMADGTLKVKPLVTHVYPLDDAEEACENLIQTPNEALGVVLKAK